VVIVSVVVTGEVPVTLTDGEENVHIAPVGQPLATPTSTAPVNPFRGVMVIVEIPDCPGAEMFTGFAEMPKSVTLTVLTAEVDAA
jgi:hypothetical protein